MDSAFQLVSPFHPAGDQPKAIDALLEGVRQGLCKQTLLGVTGSGKTFTVAHVIAELNRPALILAPNKTLAAQLYSEMKAFFPHNAVEYFVSYYDYYQPEAYVPTSDTYIEKDASVNAHIEQMRLSATKSIIERRDTIVVATVSAIYGLGAPETYLDMVLSLRVGERIQQREVLKQLARMQYQRSEGVFQRAYYRMQGERLEIFPADAEKNALRIHLFDDEIETIEVFDPLTHRVEERLSKVTIFPKSHYVTPRHIILNAIDHIKEELQERLKHLESTGALLEAQRLSQRTQFDLEMLSELGYCTGIENYARYLSRREAGQTPSTMMDYLPGDVLVFMDESHVTWPQLGGMYRGDRARKETLVQYGFRLPSALDNRPLRLEEFEAKVPQMVLISATPGERELQESDAIVEQIVRPTGLLDPAVEVRPVIGQVDDLLSEIHACVAKKERVLVTTLTKRMAEDLTDYYTEQGVRVRYLHSDVETVERVEILRDLRLGVFDVLVGINLLREGLDLPEVSLVAIFDADKEGFLRAERSLIQTIGRAARHVHGRAILYADRMTGSMERAMSETQRRRETQAAFNEAHGIVPTSIAKHVHDALDKDDASMSPTPLKPLPLSPPTPAELSKLEKEMLAAAERLEFERAAELRDELEQLKVQWLSE